jgi:hypothetical protein
MIERMLAAGINATARILTGVRGEWAGCMPELRIYFAKHLRSSDLTVLLPRLRQTRPVAAAGTGAAGCVTSSMAGIRCSAGCARRGKRDSDPVLHRRGARCRVVADPVPGRHPQHHCGATAFKSGLYRLASARPDVELVPAWIDNLNRVLPKGEFVPVPLLCTVKFGAPLALLPGEGNLPFRERSRQALLDLAPAERNEM